MSTHRKYLDECLATFIDRLQSIREENDKNEFDAGGLNGVLSNHNSSFRSGKFI